VGAELLWTEGQTYEVNRNFSQFCELVQKTYGMHVQFSSYLERCITFYASGHWMYLFYAYFSLACCEIYATVVTV